MTTGEPWASPWLECLLVRQPIRILLDGVQAWEFSKGMSAKHLALPGPARAPTGALGDPCYHALCLAEETCLEKLCHQLQYLKRWGWGGGIRPGRARPCRRHSDDNSKTGVSGGPGPLCRASATQLP